LIINLSNPKVILFVLALIPQFVDAALPVLPQFLIYGAMLSCSGFIVNGAVGLFAGGIGKTLARGPVAGRVFGYLSGALFAGLAVRLAVMERV
jgi:threonine/homoserine/homoserine lactone efflux protein